MPLESNVLLGSYDLLLKSLHGKLSKFPARIGKRGLPGGKEVRPMYQRCGQQWRLLPDNSKLGFCIIGQVSGESCYFPLEVDQCLLMNSDFAQKGWSGSSRLIGEDSLSVSKVVLLFLGYSH